MNPTTLSVFLFLNFKGAKNFAPEEEKVEEKKKKKKLSVIVVTERQSLGRIPKGWQRIFARIALLSIKRQKNKKGGWIEKEGTRKFFASP